MAVKESKLTSGKWYMMKNVEIFLTRCLKHLDPHPDIKSPRESSALKVLKVLTTQIRHRNQTQELGDNR